MDEKDRDEQRIHSVDPKYVMDRWNEESEQTTDAQEQAKVQEPLEQSSENKNIQQEEQEKTTNHTSEYPQGDSWENPPSNRDPFSSPYSQIPPANPSGHKKSGWHTFWGTLASLASLGIIVFGLWLAASQLNSGSVQKNPPDGDSPLVNGPTSPSEDAGKEQKETNSFGSNVDLTIGEIGTTGNVTATLLDVSPIVEEVFPSVVAVTNKTVYTSTNSFWGQSSQAAEGAGSGVIIGQNEEELLIVSNAHVVIPESYQHYSVSSCEISIKFANDKEVSAYVKGTDTSTDLAVIAVPLSEIDKKTSAFIKVAAIGDSDQLKVGNGVIAIGNALGYGLSVTVGYVSALNREVVYSDKSVHVLLQTDAAINPGNSGGGLFDMYGRLIAINSAKYSAEDVEGMGYAIPITEVKETIVELMNREARHKVTDENKKCALGVALDGNYQGLYEGTGAFITSVTEDGPAAKAGLMAYDIITAINGTKVTSWDEMKEELSYYEGGTEITVDYLSLEVSGNNRRYVEKSTKVTLGYAKDIIKQ